MQNKPMPEFQPNTKLAIEAARKAGARALEIYSTDFKVSEKEPGQLLTRADVDADAAIHEALAGSGYPILSEESADDPARLGARRVWIVDPLDGTSDFVNKTGEFSIMIALVERQKSVIGVVYAPTTDALYVAESGRGAFCSADGGWKQLHVSATSSTPSAKAVVSRHHFTDKERAILDGLGVREFMQKGSAGLKIADIAQGTADFYFTLTNKIKQWDTAAAYCILREAGGRMTDMLGGELVYNTEDVYHQHGILASNGVLHDAVARLYKNLN